MAAAAVYVAGATRGRNLTSVINWQVEEYKRLLAAEKDLTVRAQAGEADAKIEADRMKGQVL
jgi:hypothetical protein